MDSSDSKSILKTPSPFKSILVSVSNATILYVLFSWVKDSVLSSELQAYRRISDKNSSEFFVVFIIIIETFPEKSEF
jgi:hypothetical protein